MKKTSLVILVVVGIIIGLSVALVLGQIIFPNNSQILNLKSLVTGGGSISVDRAMAEPSAMMAESLVVGDSVGVSVAERKVIKNGYLDILVATAEDTVASIKVLAEQAKGFVSSSEIYETSPGVKSGSITIRVPADKFDILMLAIKELAVKVEKENINSSDVTEQSINLNSRLKNFESEEAQYLAILKKAEKVEEILNVTRQLNEVRSQIDSLESQLKYLNSQVEMSTITVNLTAEKDISILGLRWTPLATIKQAVRSLLDGLVNYANMIIAIVIFLPVVALWIVTILIVIWLIWRIARLIKTKKIACPIACSTKKLAKKSSPKV